MRDRRPTPVLFAVFAALAVLAAAAGPSAAAERAELLPPAPGDLVADTLSTAAAPVAPDLERRPLAASWPVPPGRVLDGEHRPFVAASRSFTLRVAAAELARGAELPTVTPGAVVRLTPLDGAARGAVEPERLEVVDPQGRAHPAGSGITLPVGPEALTATGLPFLPGSSAFRLRPELGAGRFVFRVPGLEAGGDYLMHVFERGSAAV